jgi:phosphoribosylaminoimidazole-succinocarboxamide synthase
MDTDCITATDLHPLVCYKRGKVRDIYEVGDRLLIVATDRISAFDVVLPTGIPDKGRVLTEPSRFWFSRTQDIVPNHFLTTGEAACRPFGDTLAGRTMLGRKAQPLPVECIVRGYLAGSAWREYQEAGAVCGIPLPAGLQESSRLREPIFTPSTKADDGSHDENLAFEHVVELLGPDLTEVVRDLSLALYRRGQAIAEPRGIIVADTKFEFGVDEETKQLILIDEVLTPDSSRFWPKEEYAPGRPQRSFDKQVVRDYLESLGWDKRPPAPPLPQEVIARTRARYLEALGRLTGLSSGSQEDGPCR